MGFVADAPAGFGCAHDCVLKKVHTGAVDARFFRNAGGTEPVREWLKGLSKGDRYQIGEDVRYVQTRFRMWG